MQMAQWRKQSNPDPNPIPHPKPNPKANRKGTAPFASYRIQIANIFTAERVRVISPILTESGPKATICHTNVGLIITDSLVSKPYL